MNSPEHHFKDIVKPLPGEIIVQKSVNSAFIGTDLKQQLDKKGIRALVIAGLTTDHCVSTTTRMAGNYGYETYVVADATATFGKIGINGQHYDGETMHQTAMAQLNKEFATVIHTHEIINHLNLSSEASSNDQNRIIKNTRSDDFEEILNLYEHARQYQKIKGAVLWPEFEERLLKTEISSNQQWKIVIDDQIACVWSTTFSDPQIWLEQNEDPSIYIHRIATNPAFRGRNLVGEIVAWAKEHARENGKKFIRMDTVGKNEALINYYQKCGFAFLGLQQLDDTDGLPAHYHNAKVSLFQIAI